MNNKTYTTSLKVIRKDTDKQRCTKLIDQRFIIFKISTIHKMLYRFNVIPILKKMSGQIFIYLFKLILTFI